MTEVHDSVALAASRAENGNGARRALPALLYVLDIVALLLLVPERKGAELV